MDRTEAAVAKARHDASTLVLEAILKRLPMRAAIVADLHKTLEALRDLPSEAATAQALDEMFVFLDPGADTGAS